MWKPTPEDVHKITGCQLFQIQECLQHLYPALEMAGITSKEAVTAALATVYVECGFRCIKEHGSKQYFERMYWHRVRVRKMLGNLTIDDASKYSGRGYVQITGRWNYAHFSKKINMDLINYPDLALKKNIAAKIFVEYFKERRVHIYAENDQWERSRKAVNGGLTHFEKYMKCVDKLLQLPD